MKKHKVRILYRSGNTMDVEVEDMKVTRQGAGLSVTWTAMEPYPLLLGVDDIEAIFQL